MSSTGNKVTTVIATSGYGNDNMTEISYTETKVFGNGSFGVVFQAKLLEENEIVAIKKVLQDRRFKNRELQIMRKLRHTNIVKLKYFFYSSGDKRDEVYLNLVLEFMPETLYKVERQYSRAKQTVPVNYVRLYMYQLFRALAYIHSYSICHRDIKPQNLLLDAENGVLKLCDFGSAKQLIHGETNVAYICSRYYRAPELIFGATNYSTKIDIWSAGCVLAELLLGQLIFPGDSGVDQIVEIVKVMGTPSAEQMADMNSNYKGYKLPQLKPHPWQKVFRIRTPPEAIDLVSKLLIYTPNSRISPLMACAHPFFDEMRQDPHQLLPNGRPLPPLFNFTEHELNIDTSVTPLLLPRAEQSGEKRTTEHSAEKRNYDHSTEKRNTAGAELSQVSETSAAKINALPPSSQSKASSAYGVVIQPNSLPKSSRQLNQTAVHQRQPPKTNIQQPHCSAGTAAATAVNGSVGVGHAAKSMSIRKALPKRKTHEMGNGDGVGIGSHRATVRAPATFDVDEVDDDDDNVNDDDEEDEDDSDDNIVVDGNVDDDDVDDDDNDDEADDNDDDDDDEADDDDENEFNVNYSSSSPEDI